MAAYRQHDPSAAPAAKPDGTRLLPELLAALKKYMEDMDVDAADETIKLIEGYSYSDKVHSAINELKTAVLSLDEEKTAELTEMMIGEIAK